MKGLIYGRAYFRNFTVSPGMEHFRRLDPSCRRKISLRKLFIDGRCFNFFSFPCSYICFKNKLDIPIFVTGILAGLVSITGMLAMIETMRLCTFFCLFCVLSVYFSVQYSPVSN